MLFEPLQSDFESQKGLLLPMFAALNNCNCWTAPKSQTKLRNLECSEAFGDHTSKEDLSGERLAEKMVSNRKLAKGSLRFFWGF